METDQVEIMRVRIDLIGHRAGGSFQYTKNFQLPFCTPHALTSYYELIKDNLKILIKKKISIQFRFINNKKVCFLCIKLLVKFKKFYGLTPIRISSAQNLTYFFLY